MENKHCKICYKEIPEARLQQGKTTCCHRCAVKLSCLNPEVSAKKSAAQKRRFQDPEKYEKFCKSIRKPETRQKLSEAGLRRYQNPEEHTKQSAKAKDMHKDPVYRANFLAGMHSEETINKISIAQTNRFKDPEKHQSFVEAMNKPETKKNLRKAQSSEDTKQKIHDTKKQNHSFNSSSSEEYAYSLISKVFNTEVIEKQYRSELYPFNCDFYISSLDLYIECHFNWTHGGGSYDKNEEWCKVQLSTWQEKAKTSQFYQNAIYTWTDLDVRKRQCAIDNKLNWLCFYSFEELESWLNKGIILL